MNVAPGIYVLHRKKKLNRFESPSVVFSLLSSVTYSAIIYYKTVIICIVSSREYLRGTAVANRPIVHTLVSKSRWSKDNNSSRTESPVGRLTPCKNPQRIVYRLPMFSDPECGRVRRGEV